LYRAGHYQSGFAGLIHAAKPAGVEKMGAQLVLNDVTMFPDLHGLAAARARIIFAGDNDALLALPLPAQRPLRLSHSS
jgi:hypothetical protein